MSKKKGLGWKYSKHITMQEAWDIFSKDDFFNFNNTWICESLKKNKTWWKFMDMWFFPQHLSNWLHLTKYRGSKNKQ